MKMQKHCNACYGHAEPTSDDNDTFKLSLSNEELSLFCE